MDLKRLQNFAIIYIAIWAISPPLFGSIAARILVIVATLIWVILEVLRSDGLMRRITAPVLLALLYIAYTGIVEYSLSGAPGLLTQIQIWIMLFFLVVWQSRRDDLQSLVPVFWVVLAIHPIWQFVTVRTILTEDSHAARIIVRSSVEATELIAQGVGGYSLVYATLLLIPGLVGLARNRNLLNGAALPPTLRTRPRVAFWMVLLNIGLGVALVLTAGYSIAVVALIGILVSLTFLKTFNAPRLLLTLMAALVFLALAQEILQAVLTALLPLAEGTSYANKIRDMLSSLELGAASGTLEDRSERYYRSLALFAENPLFGTLSIDNLGKHSQFLDGLARWGVIFGGIFLYLIIFPAVRMMRQSKREFGTGLSMLVAIIIIFGLNNGFAGAGLMLYIMFPVSLHILRTGGVRRPSRSPVTVHA